LFDRILQARGDQVGSVRKFGRNDGRSVFKTMLLRTLATAIVSVSCRSFKSRWPSRSRQPLCFPKHMADLSETKFRRLYRLSKAQFLQLSDLLKPALSRAHSRPVGSNSALTTEVMLAISLRILAGACYLDVAWPYGVAEVTVYAILDETLRVIDRVLDNIHFPSSEAECLAEAKTFQAARGSPLFGIIAALDGIAISIHCPRRTECSDPRKYYNRKGFYAICVQAAVTADYRVRFVSARHAGSTHDSTAYCASSLHSLLERKEEEGGLPAWACIAADDAYGNGGRILTPYSGRGLDPQKDSFNYHLSSYRIFVEQVFGIIVSHFGILWSPMRCSVEKAALIVVVCCRIHNFSLQNPAEQNEAETFCAPPDPDNRVNGRPTVFTQDELHVDARPRLHRPAENRCSTRDRIARELHLQGFSRPR
jgi:hypothetical protein